MITIYKIKEDGSVVNIQIEKSKLQTYLNDGWQEEEPVDLLGAIEEEGKAGQDIELGGGVNYTSTSPFGYPSLINTGQKNEDGTPKFQDVNVYLQGLNPQGNWYYPGDEDIVLDKLIETPKLLRTLQDRLVRTQWLSIENYTQEYGRAGRETRNALIKAMTASNFSTGVGYDTAIDLELLNPGEEIYIPKQYRESDKATRLQTVDAIFNSIGREPTRKERNYYEVLLKDLEEKEFFTDEAIARMEVEGPEVTVTETRKPGVEPLSERPIQIVEEETTVEPIPETIDAVSRLQERISGDFEGVLARQQNVAKARNNVGNISQSIMRLKSLGG
jgi:hypothetical protein